MISLFRIAYGRVVQPAPVAFTLTSFHHHQTPTFFHFSPSPKPSPNFFEPPIHSVLPILHLLGICSCLRIRSKTLNHTLFEDLTSCINSLHLQKQQNQNDQSPTMSRALADEAIVAWGLFTLLFQTPGANSRMLPNHVPLQCLYLPTHIGQQLWSLISCIYYPCGQQHINLWITARNSPSSLISPPSLCSITDASGTPLH